MHVEGSWDKPVGHVLWHTMHNRGKGEGGGQHGIIMIFNKLDVIIQDVEEDL